MHARPMSATLRAAIVGASGYAGAELVRLLAAHPQVEIDALYARGRDGKTWHRWWDGLRWVDWEQL